MRGGAYYWMHLSDDSPIGIVGDAGVENVAAREFMEELRGPNRGSFLTGKSVLTTPTPHLTLTVRLCV